MLRHDCFILTVLIICVKIYLKVTDKWVQKKKKSREKRERKKRSWNGDIVGQSWLFNGECLFQNCSLSQKMWNKWNHLKYVRSVFPSLLVLWMNSLLSDKCTEKGSHLYSSLKEIRGTSLLPWPSSYICVEISWFQFPVDSLKYSSASWISVSCWPGSQKGTVIQSELGFLQGAGTLSVVSGAESQTQAVRTQQKTSYI